MRLRRVDISSAFSLASSCRMVSRVAASSLRKRIVSSLSAPEEAAAAAAEEVEKEEEEEEEEVDNGTVSIVLCRL